MITNKLAAAVSGVVIALAAAPNARAYEVSTHRIITAHAVERSQVYTNSSILADIGMASYQGEVSSDIVFGVQVEDTVNADLNIARVFNHFYDPQFNNYAGRGLTVAGVTFGHASPDWALEDRGDVSTYGVATKQFAGMEQQNSLREAQRDLWYVLTGQNPTTRSDRAVDMLYTLGSVVHHLQDMGQPQHTRNEQHALGPNAYYEGYTQDNFNASIAAMLPAAPNQYPIPQLGSARAYWFSQQSAVDRVPRYLGMAEFTAHNFVSNATGFFSDLNGKLLAHPGLPRPNGFNQDDGSPKQIVAMNVPIRHLDGTTLNENGYFVASHIVDQLPGTTPKTRLIAMSSIFDRPMLTTVGRRVFTVSDAVFNSGYDVLLPRASAFTTGLIDYFFRGRVDIRRDTGNTGWVFENRSGTGQTMNGQVSLWYEESNGLRYPFPGTNTFNIVNLAPNSANTLAAGEPPLSATKVIAAFQGQIGAEPADISGGYFAAAGKVITYGRPDIPCSTDPTKNGWFFLNLLGDGRGINNGGSVNPGLVDLGSRPGRIYGEFNSRWASGATRWSFTIRRGSASGTVLYSSGFFSGLKDFSFNHSGGYEDSQRKVHVRVAPEISPNTTQSNVWGMQVGCPDVEFTDANRAQPRVTLNLSISVPSGFCQDGQVEFFLDGNSAGIVLLPRGNTTGGAASTYPFSPKAIPGEHHLRAVTTLTTNKPSCGGVTTVGWTGPDGRLRTFNAGGANITVPEP